MKKNNLLVTIIIVVLALVAIGAFVFSGSRKGGVAEAGEYDTFAQCLYDNGMRMYGSDPRAT